MSDGGAAEGTAPASPEPVDPNRAPANRPSLVKKWAVEAGPPPLPKRRPGPSFHFNKDAREKRFSLVAPEGVRELLPYEPARMAQRALREVSHFLEKHEDSPESAQEMTGENDAIKDHLKRLSSALDGLLDFQVASQQARHSHVVHTGSRRDGEGRGRRRHSTGAVRKDSPESAQEMTGENDAIKDHLKRLSSALDGLLDFQVASQQARHSHVVHTGSRRDGEGRGRRRHSTGAVRKAYTRIPPERDYSDDLILCDRLLENYKKEVERDIWNLERQNRTMTLDNKRTGAALDRWARAQSTHAMLANELHQLQLQLTLYERKRQELRLQLKEDKGRLKEFSEQEAQNTVRLKKLRLILEERGLDPDQEIAQFRTEPRDSYAHGNGFGSVAWQIKGTGAGPVAEDGSCSRSRSRSQNVSGRCQPGEGAVSDGEAETKGRDKRNRNTQLKVALQRHIAVLQNTLARVKKKAQDGEREHQVSVDCLNSQLDTLRKQVRRAEKSSDASLGACATVFESLPTAIKTKLAVHYLPDSPNASEFRKKRLGSLLVERQAAVCSTHTHGPAHVTLKPSPSRTARLYHLEQGTKGFADPPPQRMPNDAPHATSSHSPDARRKEETGDDFREEQPVNKASPNPSTISRPAGLAAKQRAQQKAKSQKGKEKKPDQSMSMASELRSVLVDHMKSIQSPADTQSGSTSPLPSLPGGGGQQEQTRKDKEAERAREEEEEQIRRQKEEEEMDMLEEEEEEKEDILDEKQREGEEEQQGEEEAADAAGAVSDPRQTYGQSEWEALDDGEDLEEEEEQENEETIKEKHRPRASISPPSSEAASSIQVRDHTGNDRIDTAPEGAEERGNAADPSASSSNYPVKQGSSGVLGGSVQGSQTGQVPVRQLKVGGSGSSNSIASILAKVREQQEAEGEEGGAKEDDMTSGWKPVDHGFSPSGALGRDATARRLSEEKAEKDIPQPDLLQETDNEAHANSLSALRKEQTEAEKGPRHQSESPLNPGMGSLGSAGVRGGGGVSADYVPSFAPEISSQPEGRMKRAQPSTAAKLLLESGGGHERDVTPPAAGAGADTHPAGARQAAASSPFSNSPGGPGSPVGGAVGAGGDGGGGGGGGRRGRRADAGGLDGPKEEEDALLDAALGRNQVEASPSSGVPAWLQEGGLGGAVGGVGDTAAGGEQPRKGRRPREGDGGAGNDGLGGFLDAF
uniref:Uncharacterized protein n=1 Tax=Chromera velia CCMP2878 TaxID=1169474 RepID=A0A0G4FSA4_9ALVE|eukprot:Cvel_3691.t1-p1 / transcript=Cvel_3691.t1 / gene=Cvel_3691 / organism=Chromera_velia_CCMP2878 / gene_product=hypothetical protein / transcript_product=hypothetical protein / location=Cvel_scaffold153:76724-85171(+) / protein_length=1201 / sequence_SO=supercontig / SO=protein_coding / is_pseudo=false